MLRTEPDLEPRLFPVMAALLSVPRRASGVGGKPRRQSALARVGPRRFRLQGPRCRRGRPALRRARRAPFAAERWAARRLADPDRGRRPPRPTPGRSGPDRSARPVRPSPMTAISASCPGRPRSTGGSCSRTAASRAWRPGQGVGWALAVAYPSSGTPTIAEQLLTFAARRLSSDGAMARRAAGVRRGYELDPDLRQRRPDRRMAPRNGHRERLDGPRSAVRRARRLRRANGCVSRAARATASARSPPPSTSLEIRPAAPSRSASRPAA